MNKEIKDFTTVIGESNDIKGRTIVNRYDESLQDLSELEVRFLKIEKEIALLQGVKVDNKVLNTNLNEIWVELRQINNKINKSKV